MNILIIDDDVIDRESVRRALARQHKDAVFFEADCGAAAIEMIGTTTFDCIFLDYHLPDMDGIALLCRFFDDEKGLAVAPTVMLTGQGSESVMVDAIHCGAQDYLVKDSISTDTLNIALMKAREMFRLQQGKFMAEEQLRHAGKMEAVGQLTSGIAHDFNNLLTVILGNTRLMKKRLHDDTGRFSKEDFTKKITAIEDAARRGADLVRRLMVFTRQGELNVEVIELNRKIAETHELLKITLGALIETRLDLSDEIWPVALDAVQFENALINIALNARDAMAGGGHLTIETRNITGQDAANLLTEDDTAGEYVMVAISDTGKGMPEDVQNRIFEPFFTTKGAGEGTGLGLSMVYGFIGQSKGFIRVHSEEDSGTTFRIYLPRHNNVNDA